MPWANAKPKRVWRAAAVALWRWQWRALASNEEQSGHSGLYRVCISSSQMEEQRPAAAADCGWLLLWQLLKVEDKMATENDAESWHRSVRDGKAPTDWLTSYIDLLSLSPASRVPDECMHSWWWWWWWWWVSISEHSEPATVCDGELVRRKTKSRGWQTLYGSAEESRGEHFATLRNLNWECKWQNFLC